MNSPEFAFVHVALLNEGTNVWRRVEAMAVEGGYQLVAPWDYDEEFEEWEFPPGSNVRCEMRTLADGPALVAMALV